MKVTLAGPYRLDDFHDAIGRLITNLRANGIEDISKISMYFQISSNGVPVHLEDPFGQEIEHLVLDAEVSRVFEPVTDDLRVMRSWNSKLPGGK